MLVPCRRCETAGFDPAGGACEDCGGAGVRDIPQSGNMLASLLDTACFVTDLDNERRVDGGPTNYRD
jgi:hypothetical protein